MEGVRFRFLDFNFKHLSVEGMKVGWMLAGGGVCLGGFFLAAVVAAAVVVGRRKWRKRNVTPSGRRGRNNLAFQSQSGFPRDVSDDFAFYPVDGPEEAYEMGRRSTVGSLQRRSGADAARVRRSAVGRQGEIGRADPARVSYHRNRKRVIPFEVVVDVRAPRDEAWEEEEGAGAGARAESLFPPPPSLLLPPAMSTFRGDPF